MNESFSNPSVCSQSCVHRKHFRTKCLSQLIDLHFRLVTVRTRFICCFHLKCIHHSKLNIFPSLYNVNTILMCPHVHLKSSYLSSFLFPLGVRTTKHSPLTVYLCSVFTLDLGRRWSPAAGNSVNTQVAMSLLH